MNTTTEFWRDPAMPHVEARRACHSRACYQPHSHPTFSIGAVDQGHSVFTGAADGPTLIKSGSLVFVAPDCVHACNPLPDNAWSYQMLHLDAHWINAVKHKFAARDGRRLVPAQVLLTRDAGAYSRFCRLNNLLFSGASVPEKETALIEFIGGCNSNHNDQGEHRDDEEIVALPATPARANHTAHKLQQVMAFLHQDSAAMHPLMALTDIAEMAGMSRYQLIRAFRVSTGMTPHAYQLNLRINRARSSLCAGESIADMAYRLGFSDQSHFQRVFKLHAGVTPGRYRA